MKLAVLSGKGGAGKTLMAVNLAVVASPALYVDCDVEEPNGHLFLKPGAIREVPVKVKVPRVLHEECDGCRACVDFCRFHALAYTNKVIVFDEVCHACGGCALVCPQKAIMETDRIIGRMEKGVSGVQKKLEVFTGFLNPGEAAGTPVIRSLLKELPETTLTVIDCPPGSACSVMESIQEADFCLLVAEPTRFGRDNLEMVHQLVKLFHKPHGLVLNKTTSGANPSEDYANTNALPILGRLSHDRHLGEMHANGKVVAQVDSHYRKWFETLLCRVKQEVLQ
ncbi:4Fe-4S dicluster domain-containing protein [Anoxynatronum buryatiense]|uniref:MinD superfamily P-loop ATPase, contains an inserted ferredoxin domain n=1 Tax=Anoxynatronum buryatiense TaxID=489973 RepID=A0AA45WTJ1_9CLOT|nr:4Fe-4S dicluster domain-containing protein [Anoxynatronum buryatiense]SMP43350.1 MinD superfamily P-loop ATPase, contains an inserted ferredoxin domain [Anoxynatronum buryatiense]